MWLLSAAQGTLRGVKATRKTQPYRYAGGRAPGPTLDAMLRGGPAFLPNPQDLLRGTLRQRKRRGRLPTQGRGRLL